MLKFGRPKVAVIPLLGILFLGVGFLAATAAVGGVRINTSYSLPLGIYVRTHDQHNWPKVWDAATQGTTKAHGPSETLRKSPRKG
jgi:type IV secretory pathway protease TraF